MCGLPHFFVMAPKAKSGAGGARKITAKEKQKAEAEAKRSATQAIRENVNFKGFSSGQLYSTVVGGFTLYDRIYKDKLAYHLGKPEAPPFGGNYFKNVSQLYRGAIASGACQSSMLMPVDAACACSPALVQAMYLWDCQPRKSGPLLEYLRLGEEVPFLKN